MCSREIVGRGQAVSQREGMGGCSVSGGLEKAETYVSLRMLAMAVGSEVGIPLWWRVLAAGWMVLRLFKYAKKGLGLCLA